MNMLKKGPELKISSLKVPDFVLDVYYDLKERHLLPLVAILLVALVALPIVLSKSSGSEEAEEGAAVATPSAAASTSSLVVAQAAPGLRDYRRRLSGHTATDPFVQRFSGGGEGGETRPGTPTEATTEASGSTSGEPSGGSGTEASPVPTGEGGGNGEPPSGGHLKYYSWTIDVRVTPVSSGKGKSKATTRDDLPEMTMLPSKSVPALTFVGVTKDEKNAIMLVSDKVTGIFGDATCTVGSEACQLIALEPEIPETIVYGADSRTYRIELLKVKLTETDKLNTAPLGKSKKQKGGGGKSEQSLTESFVGGAPVATASK
jgi:hypothetical protein